MSNTINKSDIGETMVYDWVCPKCHQTNEVYEGEPRGGDTLECEICNEDFAVIDE